MKQVILWLILGMWLAGPVRAFDSTVTGIPEMVGTASARMKQEAIKSLQTISDSQKRAAVQLLSEKLCVVQNKQLAELNKSIESMGTVLGKVTAQAAELKSKGKDTAALEAAVAKADSLRAQAKENLVGFSGQGCGLVVTGNKQTLATESGKTITTVEAQLRQLREQVKAARLAAGQAVTLLGKLTRQSATK